LSPQEIDRISPWRFRAPVSPDLAAQREGRTIDVDSVVEYCQSALEQRREILLIEGVGGVMAPLDQHRTILDVMMALELPLILVTGSYPGSISHTLTALDSLYRRDLNVIATIISESPGSQIALDDVVAVISRFTDTVISLPRPRHAGGDPSGAALGRLFDPQGRRAQSSSGTAQGSSGSPQGGGSSTQS
jgi:dethiobiotin synthetase